MTAVRAGALRRAAGEVAMADDDVLCTLVGSEAVPAAMEAAWGEVLHAAEALEAALAGHVESGNVGRLRRSLRAYVLLLCAEPVTGAGEIRRKMAVAHLLHDLDDPEEPLAVAMAAAAVRDDLERLGLSVDAVMEDALN